MNATTPAASTDRWPDFARTGPDTPAGKYLRNFWQPVYVSSRLEAGRAVPLKIMGEGFTLFRGADGQAQVLSERCLHRRTLLSTGTVEGNELRCFYHGWKYAMSGQCTERPAERGAPPHLRLRSYPTREWVGLVFAYLGEGEPPPFQTLDHFSGEGFLGVQAPLRRFNYFNQIENSLDEVHFNFVHRISRFSEDGLNAIVPTLNCEETDYGLARTATRGDVQRQTHFLMPSTNLSLLFGAWHLVWRVPVDDASHISFTVDFIKGTPQQVQAYRSRYEADIAALATAAPAADLTEAILRGEMRMEDVIDHPDLLSVQDGVALAGQGVIADREHETLGTTDNHIVRVRRMWAHDMEALQQGRAPRTWRWPSTLSPTSGVLREAAAA
ncbi:MAG: Rieske 2Fe-2S domain-containing protein [Burkholderiaceae bacterium]|nr:Rieske 2Fe-2S domain-containing protein [Burkholderiaceae bacterium]MDO9090016.1 Rieske 2Fe-2S domain-containing protein [Burkholderiaceae bacterium]